MNRIKSCKYCGNDIAKNAKVCPTCGGVYKKPFYKKIKFWILVFIIISTSNAVEKINKNIEKASCVTQDKYNSVQTGMTYDQVKQIFGCDSKQVIEDNLADTTGFYSNKWYTKDGQKSIFIYFTNGKVSSKYGL